METTGCNGGIMRQVTVPTGPRWTVTGPDTLIFWRAGVQWLAGGRGGANGRMPIRQRSKASRLASSQFAQDFGHVFGEPQTPAVLFSGYRMLQLEGSRVQRQAG